MNMIRLTTAILATGLLVCNAANAGVRIAVLDFELNDITSLPNIPAEKRRTATIRPLLEQAVISQAGEYEIVRIDMSDQAAANSGIGYLFRFDDLAAELGERFGADWIIVGQHSKPSFLYSYLMAHLINVKTRTLAANYNIELKGSHEKVMERGVNSLAGKIHKLIDK